MDLKISWSPTWSSWQEIYWVAYFEQPKTINLVFVKFGTRLLEANPQLTEISLRTKFSINVDESLDLID